MVGAHDVGPGLVKSVKDVGRLVGSQGENGLVHQRWFRVVPRKGYAKRLVQAHNLHHATVSKHGGVSFGFVLVRDPAKLKAALKRQQASGLVMMRDGAGSAI